MLSNGDYNILRLFRSRNVGPLTFFRLLDYFGDCETAIDNIHSYNRKSKKPITIASKDEIDRELLGCSTIGAKIITYKNPQYPRLLRTIDTFPPVLTTLGDLDLFNRSSISIVGSRTASSNGCNFARKISRELGEAGYVITSGLASGIDAFAHMGAVNTGTIAVLGGGVDDIYPKSNEELYYQIKDKGLIISEVALNSAPRVENFPARNRIISGLSIATVIIEAGIRSGTIHTSRQVIEQNRELLVVPGNPYDPRCEGSNKLIKEGATVVIGTEDIIEPVSSLGTNMGNVFTLNDSSKNRAKFIESKVNNSGSMEDEIEFENEHEDLPALADKKLIISKLNHTPISIDLLAENLNMKINTLNSELTELELDGRIIIQNGMVSLKGIG